MPKQKTQLTEFQCDKISRDQKIVREFSTMKGAASAKTVELSKKYKLTVSMIYKIRAQYSQSQN